MKKPVRHFKALPPADELAGQPSAGDIAARQLAADVNGFPVSNIASAPGSAPGRK